MKGIIKHTVVPVYQAVAGINFPAKSNISFHVEIDFIKVLIINLSFLDKGN